MERLWRRLRAEGLRPVFGLLLGGYAAALLWQALEAAGDPDQWARVLHAAVALAFAIVAVTFHYLRRPIPVLQSRNSYLSAAGWVALVYLLFGTMALTAPYQPPLTVWILSGILGYGVTVVVKQIQQQPPE